MGLRIILESDGCLNFVADSQVTEIHPEYFAVRVDCDPPDTWGSKWVELSEEEVKEVLEVLRTILEERLKNV